MYVKNPLWPFVVLGSVVASLISVAGSQASGDSTPILKDGTYRAYEADRPTSGASLTFTKEGDSVVGIFATPYGLRCYRGTLRGSEIWVASVVRREKDHSTGAISFQPISEDERKRFTPLRFGPSVDPFPRTGGLIPPNRKIIERDTNWLNECKGHFSQAVELAGLEPAAGCEKGDAVAFGRLYPISPYQTSKEYLNQESSAPKPAETPAESADCKVKSRGAKPVCLATYRQYRYRMVAPYHTDTGELVMAEWETAFQEQDENMATLAILGTSIYPDPDADPGMDPSVAQTIPGHTYEVAKSEFVCFRQPTDEERQRAEKEIEHAEADPDFSRQGRLFVRRSE